jgi:hypothetical protein
VCRGLRLAFRTSVVSVPDKRIYRRSEVLLQMDGYATNQDLSKFGGVSGDEWNHQWLSGLQGLGSPRVLLEFASRE